MRDGYIAIAMVNIPQLAKAIHSEALGQFAQEQAFSARDEIKRLLSEHLVSQPVAYWLERLHAEDLWAMEVLDWKRLTAHEGYQCLQMEQELVTTEGKKIVTTRCPIRIDGQRIFSGKPAPRLGKDNEKVIADLLK